jgi:hypothetical protein
MVRKNMFWERKHSVFIIKEFYQLADPEYRKLGDVRFVTNAGSIRKKIKS